MPAQLFSLNGDRMDLENYRTRKSQLRLAVLIDADNASSENIDAILNEVAKYGLVTVKRVYGDWTNPYLKGWKEKLNYFAIQPIQQFAYTTGKNATDSAMIIDAMDLFYTGTLDGFCIVSSDSDFTRLSTRLQESGKIVLGIGERKTPISFVNACTKFIYTNNLAGIEQETDNAVQQDIFPLDDKLKALLSIACEATADENGWSNLANMGNHLLNLKKDFDPRTYGFEKLGELIQATDWFEIEKFSSPQNEQVKKIYVKLKLQAKLKKVVVVRKTL